MKAVQLFAEKRHMKNIPPLLPASSVIVARAAVVEHMRKETYVAIPRESNKVRSPTYRFQGEMRPTPFIYTQRRQSSCADKQLR